MAAPEGYALLAIVGYTDKGTYSSGTTYNKYNVVLYDGSSYVAIKDGVTGVTPSNDGVNWRTFANGFPSNGVTTDNFQSTLGNYLANNGTTTNSGFALDARYGKTLQDSVDALNRKIKSGTEFLQSTTGEVVTKSVKFDTPFSKMPAVILSVKTGMPNKRMAAPNNVNASGFIIALYDESQAGQVVVDWIAYEI